MLLQDVRVHPNLNPLWWRVPLWAVVIAVSVYDTHDETAKIVVGAVMAVGATALQFVSVDDVLVQRRCRQVSGCCPAISRNGS